MPQRAWTISRIQVDGLLVLHQTEDNEWRLNSHFLERSCSASGSTCSCKQNVRDRWMLILHIPDYEASNKTWTEATENSSISLRRCFLSKLAGHSISVRISALNRFQAKRIFHLMRRLPVTFVGASEVGLCTSFVRSRSDTNHYCQWKLPLKAEVSNLKFLEPVSTPKCNHIRR